MSRMDASGELISRNSLKLDHNNGDYCGHNEDLQYNEDERGYEVNFLGGNLLKSKFISFKLPTQQNESSSESEDEGSNDVSASLVPSSIESKKISDLHKNRNRKINWLWNQGRSGGTVQVKRVGMAAKGRAHGDIIPSSPKNFQIDGDTFILFGRKLPIDREGQEPLEDDLPEFVYSEEYGTAEYSFLENDTYSNKSPPPLYFEFEEINKPKPTDKDEVLQAFKLNDKGYLECHDQKIKESNKGVIPYVLKELAKNVLTGKGVVSISLPVRIFQPKSLLERILDACSFVPTFFKKA